MYPFHVLRRFLRDIHSLYILHIKQAIWTMTSNRFGFVPQFIKAFYDTVSSSKLTFYCNGFMEPFFWAGKSIKFGLFSDNAIRSESKRHSPTKVRTRLTLT